MLKYSDVVVFFHIHGHAIITVMLVSLPIYRHPPLHTSLRCNYSDVVVSLHIYGHAIITVLLHTPRHISSRYYYSAVSVPLPEHRQAIITVFLHCPPSTYTIILYLQCCYSVRLPIHHHTMSPTLT